MGECGDHATDKTSSVWDSNEWSLCESLRVSQSAIVLSDEPVMRRVAEEGANETQLISALWASIEWEALAVLVARVSQL